MPFDGDPRAAYALLHDDGTVEHRRVGYDHAAVRGRAARALRRRRLGRHADANRIEHASSSGVARRSSAAEADLDLAIALARELLHDTGALRVERRARRAAAGDRRMRAAGPGRRARRGGARRAAARRRRRRRAAALPHMRQLPPFEVDPGDGQGGRRARWAGDARARRPRPRRRCCPARSVVAADYETTDPDAPLGLAGRPGEPVVVLVGEHEFELDS